MAFGDDNKWEIIIDNYQTLLKERVNDKHRFGVIEEQMKVMMKLLGNAQGELHQKSTLSTPSMAGPRLRVAEPPRFHQESENVLKGLIYEADILLQNIQNRRKKRITIAQQQQKRVHLIGEELMVYEEEQNKLIRKEALRASLVKEKDLIAESVKVVAVAANPVLITRDIERTAKALGHELLLKSMEVQDHKLADVVAINAALNAPGIGEHKSQYLEYITILPGTNVVREEVGVSFDNDGKEILVTLLRLSSPKR